MKTKSLPDAPKWYVLQKNKSACVFCSLSYNFYFIGDKVADGYFKDEIIPSLKASNRLKFAQDVALNRVRDKEKPRCKLLYKVLKEEYGYDTLLDISPYPTMILLKEFLGGIHHFFSVVVKWIFDSKFSLVLLLTQENLDYCCMNDN